MRLSLQLFSSSRLLTSVCNPILSSVTPILYFEVHVVEAIANIISSHSITRCWQHHWHIHSSVDALALFHSISTILSSLESSWREQRQHTGLRRLAAINEARKHSKVVSKPDTRANSPINTTPLSSIAERSYCFEATQTSADYVIIMCSVAQRACENGFPPKMAKKSIKNSNFQR